MIHAKRGWEEYERRDKQRVRLFGVRWPGTALVINICQPELSPKRCQATALQIGLNGLLCFSGCVFRADARHVITLA